MKKLYTLIFLLIGLILVGCTVTPTDTKLESIQVNKENITLFIGESTTIEYEFVPNSISEEVTWNIENDDIVEVNDNIVTALNYGETSITIISSSNEEIKTIIKISVIRRIFNIIYELNGSYFTNDVVNTFEENVGLDTLATPIKDGYIFLGWYLGENKVTNVSPDINEDITLIAKWEEIYIPKEFTISYELDEGYFNESVDTTYIENIGKDSLPTPKKDGYDFAGWYLNGELITHIDSNLNQDVTLVAKWENNVDIEAATSVINLINALPYNTTYNDKEKIDEIVSIYNDLNNATKSEITNIDVLFNKQNEIKEIENDTTNITYVLGTNNYLSKDELFENFFSDFYNYIINYHGDEVLMDSGITNVQDFVSLACNFNGLGASNLYGIGNLAGRYMLNKDINGILENQSETGFFGYCYKNGLYKDLLPFFIRFFAYWRIDEGYAKPSNYGADIFAESWAPTVDIAKFFYYTVDTSYVKTERMKDCFNNTANVVYGSLPTTPKIGMSLPTDLTLRGYIFDGWYDNPEFNGSKITKINNTSEKIILYAKWIVDEDQVQKDNAEIVDIYIYNLTTTPAVQNKKTVQYVRNMFNALSKEGASLVEKYNTLIQLEEKYADYFVEPITVYIKTVVTGDLNLEFIKNDFIADFNSTTSSNISSLDELVKSKYTYMKKIGTFFKNTTMRSKWIYLLDILYEENCYRGLQIQIDRIKTNGSGDLEYVTVALAKLLQGIDSSKDAEILVDYSTSEKINAVINSYGTYEITFEKETYLPTVNISGYTFIGYVDENNNVISKVSEDMPTNLTAVYEKK